MVKRIRYFLFLIYSNFLLKPVNNFEINLSFLFITINSTYNIHYRINKLIINKIRLKKETLI